MERALLEADWYLSSNEFSAFQTWWFRFRGKSRSIIGEAHILTFWIVKEFLQANLYFIWTFTQIPTFFCGTNWALGIMSVSSISLRIDWKWCFKVANSQKNLEAHCSLLADQMQEDSSDSSKTKNKPKKLLNETIHFQVQLPNKHSFQDKGDQYWDDPKRVGGLPQSCCILLRPDLVEGLVISTKTLIKGYTYSVQITCLYWEKRNKESTQSQRERERHLAFAFLVLFTLFAFCEPHQSSLSNLGRLFCI